MKVPQAGAAEVVLLAALATWGARRFSQELRAVEPAGRGGIGNPAIAPGDQGSGAHEVARVEVPRPGHLSASDVRVRQ